MADDLIAALELGADAVLGYERTSVAERVKASFAIRAHIEHLRAGGERAAVVAYLNSYDPQLADAIESGAHMPGAGEEGR